MPSKIPITPLRLPSALKDCLKKYTNATGKTQNSVGVDALRKYLNEHGYYENEANEKSTA